MTTEKTDNELLLKQLEPWFTCPICGEFFLLQHLENGYLAHCFHCRIGAFNKSLGRAVGDWIDLVFAKKEEN